MAIQKPVRRVTDTTRDGDRTYAILTCGHRRLLKRPDQVPKSMVCGACQDDLVLADAPRRPVRGH